MLRVSVGGMPPGGLFRPPPDGIEYQDKVWRRRMTVGLRRQFQCGWQPSTDYPVNTLTLMRVVWFICHNSKGKAGFAIFWMELDGLRVSWDGRMIRTF